MRSLVAVACVAAACSSVSVDPAALAKEQPPAVALADAARARSAELGTRALETAMAGDAAQARADAGAALALDPRQARARAALGVLSMHEAQTEQPPQLHAWRRAEGELLQAVALAPDDVEVGLTLARFYVADGHGRAALAALEDALTRQPTHRAALHLAATVAYEASEERRARGYLARLLAQQPDDVESVYRLAQCEAVIAERGEDDAAKHKAWQHVVASFARYRELVPGDAQGALGEAQAHVRLWQLSGNADAPALRRALELYRTAGSLAPAEPEPAHGEGVVLEALQDGAGAEGAYREALRRRPAHAPSLLNLAALLAEHGEVREARTLWENALRTGLTATERRKVEGLLAGR